MTKSTRPITIGAALLGCLLASGSVHAATYFVAKDGSDAHSCTQAQSEATPVLTIATGLMCLAPGDSLSIKAGTYDEGFVIAQFYAISGKSWSEATTIQAFGSDYVETKGVGFCAGSAGTSVRYIVFKNLHLRGGAGLSGCG